MAAIDFSAKKNEHLVWDLAHMKNHDRAKTFAKQFEQSLCVFSGPVQQLYTNYEIYLPKDDSRKLVILPNPNAYHDTFNGLPPECCQPTGMQVVPGTNKESEQDLFLVINFKSGASKTIPLAVGLRALMTKASPTNPFLPVLTKGDLRTFQQDIPCLHLHRIIIGKITNRSDLEKRSIVTAITDKMSRYLINPQPAQ